MLASCFIEVERGGGAAVAKEMGYRRVRNRRGKMKYFPVCVCSVSLPSRVANHCAQRNMNQFSMQFIFTL